MLKATKYANVLAKIGSKRSDFLSETKLKALTQAINLTDFGFNLKETIYQERIIKILMLDSSREFERVFQESFIDDYIEIVKSSPKSVMAFLRVFVQKIEVENIKAIAKGVQAQLSLDEKKDRLYFQAEDFLQSRAIFEDASKATDIKQLAETLKNTEYYSALKQGLLSYEENGTTACIDILLDKIFFEKLHNSFHQLSKKEQRHAAFYQSLDEDSHIFLTLLRGKNLNYDSNWLRVILPEESPNISRRTMEAMVAAANFESALNIVLKGRYGTFFTKRKTPEETISIGEKAFQKAKFLHAVKSRVSEVFNIGLPLAFMIQKEVEVKNLSSICLGIEEGISPEKIQGNLLFSS